MVKRTVSGTMLILLLVGMLTLTFNIQSLMVSSSIETESVQYEASSSSETKPYGGTLRIGFFWVGEPRFPEDCLNPLLEPGAVLFFPLFEGLTRLDENCSVIPDLAESWNVSEDGLTYRFFLFQNVTWHDGHHFNASDVKYTFDTIFTDPSVNYYWTNVLNLSSTKSVDIVNAYTVDFHMEQTFAGLPCYLTTVPIMPSHLYNGTDLQSNPYNDNPIGTGPFKFVNWTSGINIALTAYEEYFRGRPYIDDYMLKRFFSFNDLQEALHTNQIDLVPEQLDPHWIAEIEEVPGLSFNVAEAFDCIYIIPNYNYNDTVLADPEVRRALSYGINRTQLIDQICLGYASSAFQPIPPSMINWYNPDIPTYDYDPQLANSTLDNAGYPIGPNGWRFNITLKTFDIPKYLGISEIIRENLQDIGVTLNVQNLTWDDLVNGNFESVLIRFSFDAPDPDNLYELFHTNCAWNIGNYSDTQVDNLLEQGRTTFNSSVRKQIYYELESTLANDLPNIFLLHSRKINGYSNDFHGFINIASCPMLGDSYCLKKVWYEPTLSGEGNCPMFICFVDSMDRRTGYDPETGQAVIEIPNSTYSGLYSVPQLVKIRSSQGKYTVELFGTGNGTYSLEIVNIALEYKHTNIPSSTIYENETIRYYVEVKPDGSVIFFDPAVDLNDDWIVDIYDAIILSVAYGSTPTSPNCARARDSDEEEKFMPLCSECVKKWQNGELKGIRKDGRLRKTKEATLLR